MELLARLASILMVVVGVFSYSNVRSQTEQANCQVTGGINNGTISQNCFKKPILEKLNYSPITKGSDGNYHRTMTVRVVADSVPSNMVIEIVGPTVVELQIRSLSGASMNVGSGQMKDGNHFVTVGYPNGMYDIDITTTDAAPSLGVGSAFNATIVNGRVSIP